MWKIRNRESRGGNDREKKNLFYLFSVISLLFYEFIFREVALKSLQQHFLMLVDKR